MKLGYIIYNGVKNGTLSLGWKTLTNLSRRRVNNVNEIDYEEEEGGWLGIQN